MPRGKTTSLHVTLTPEDRATLDAWQRTQALRHGLVRRGRVVLLLADGESIIHIAHKVGIARRHVYKWARRFQAHGVAGLEDLPKGRYAGREDEA
jgi:transposase-like protein